MRAPKKGQTQKPPTPEELQIPTDEEWAATVDRIHELHALGYKPSDIISRLNKQGHRTRKGLKFRDRNQLVRYLKSD